MAVRRLNPEQPPSFAFTPENEAWAQATIAKYPPGKQASAVIPLLWRAQEQNKGWTTEPAMRHVADKLGMAYIRVYEVATFYTMFQLAPVGAKAHVQVCGTTPCMLRGSGALIETCKHRIAEHPHELSADGNFSWEEVECLGSCANAPMVQIWSDTYEDLTPELFEKVLDGFAKGVPPKPGSQIGRRVSCPEGGPTTLSDPTLYDGSVIGAWKKRFHDAHKAAEPAVSPAPPVVPAAAPAPAAAAKPINPPAAALAANAGLVPELEARGGPGGKPLSVADLAALKATTPVGGGVSAVVAVMPELLKAPRGGKGDDLTLLWGVADKLQQRLNDMGIWHFDQIAAWTPANVVWFEGAMDGFKGRIERDKWIEQSAKLATGWRPDNAAGERPKG